MDDDAAGREKQPMTQAERYQHDIIDAAYLGISVDRMIRLDGDERAAVWEWLQLPAGNQEQWRINARRVGISILDWITESATGRSGLLQYAQQQWAIAHPEHKPLKSVGPMKQRKARAKLPAEEAASRQRASNAKSTKAHPEAHRRAVARYKSKLRAARKPKPKLCKVL